jgi:hypothetical protein
MDWAELGVVHELLSSTSSDGSERHAVPQLRDAIGKHLDVCVVNIEQQRRHGQRDCEHCPKVYRSIIDRQLGYHR